MIGDLLDWLVHNGAQSGPGSYCTYFTVPERESWIISCASCTPNIVGMLLYNLPLYLLPTQIAAASSVDRYKPVACVYSSSVTYQQSLLLEICTLNYQEPAHDPSSKQNDKTKRATSCTPRRADRIGPQPIQSR